MYKIKFERLLGLNSEISISEYRRGRKCGVVYLWWGGVRDVATKNSLEQIPLSMLSGGGNNNVGDYFEKETVLSEISLIVVVKGINLLS